MTTKEKYDDNFDSPSFEEMWDSGDIDKKKWVIFQVERLSHNLAVDYRGCENEEDGEFLMDIYNSEKCVLEKILDYINES